MRAVVTGGGTGIGRACAERLAIDGWDVTIVGRRADVLEEAVRTLGARVTSVAADASDPAGAARVAEDVGAVDALVCAAGGAIGGEGSGLGRLASAWERNFRGNVLSAVLMADALLPRMSRPGGRIVAISSISGRKGPGPYGAAKAALNNWVVDQAGKLAPDGITVNAVAPGYVPDTEFWDGRRDAAEVERRLAKVAMGRPGQLEEIADAVAYFCGPRAAFTTGQILAVDGGSVLCL